MNIIPVQGSRQQLGTKYKLTKKVKKEKLGNKMSIGDFGRLQHISGNLEDYARA